jgi:membrane protein required for colicin V production
MSNWIDIGILIILGLSGLFGLMKGFIKSAISLVSWILAFVLASYFYPVLAAQFQGFGGMGASILAYGLIFGAVIAIGLILSMILTRLVFLSVSLTVFNALLGGVFGVVRGGIFVTALTFIALFTQAPNYPIWKSSSLIGYFVDYANTINSWIPDNIRQEASQLSPDNLKNIKLDSLKAQAQGYIEHYTQGGSQPGQ